MNEKVTRKRKKVAKTKFVRVQRDQQLKELYPEAFKTVYYKLKAFTEHSKNSVTATDVFVALDKSVMRKDIATILEGASWSKQVSKGHYMFFDKKKEERRRKQMQEDQKAAEIAFFQWLPSAVSPSVIDEIMKSYRQINTMLIKKKALPNILTNVTLIGQIESAHRMTKSVFANKKLRNTADRLLTAYLAYLREKKNIALMPCDLPELKVQPNWIRFNYMNSGDFEKTVPAYCSVAGNKFEGKSWARILVTILNHEIEKNNPALDVLYKSPLLPERKSRPFLMKEKIENLNCLQLQNGYWINANQNLPRLLELIQALCLHCGYTKDQIVVYGISKKNSPDGQKRTTRTAQRNTMYSEELLAQARTIVSETFANGMRKNSIIAKKKFKSAYLERTGADFPEEIDIDNLAASIGFEYSDKIYALSGQNRAEIKTLVSDAIKQSGHVIFYEEFYQKNLDFMTRAGIFTSELLKNVLKEICPELSYSRASFSVHSNDSLEDDIASCFADCLMLTFDEIKERLAYADMASIRIACSRDPRFVWVREGTYAFTEGLSLSENDIAFTREVIAEDIKNQGFSVIQRVCIDESKDQNPNISETALRDAIYYLHFAQKYERKRSIITAPGASFSAPNVMKNYCGDLREATLKELMDYEKELTEKTIYSLQAAYENMLRVDKENFVALDAIRFDVQAVDNAIALYTNGEVIPLKSVKSFISFPEVPGLTWNLFLLDSYCEHKSIRFRSMGGPAKSKPVGAIFPSTLKFDSYDDLLAYVVAKSNLELNADNVSVFLTENAYTLRRIDPSGIIIKAQEIRNQEE